MAVIARNCEEFGIRFHGMGDPGRGIVHVIGPEQGMSQPGMTIVCGDSHTSTHGAFGALAFGIGTSEVEHVLATQTLPQARPTTMAITVDGALPPGVTAKDLVLAIIARIGTGGGVGSVLEYRGRGDRSALDGGPHDGLQHVDRGRGPRRDDRAGRHHVRLPRRPAPRAERRRSGSTPSSDWRTLPTDAGRTFDKEVVIDATTLRPAVSWGTNPAQTVTIDDVVPDPDSFTDEVERQAAEHALRYMGLKAGTPMREIAVDTVFIGSCTNSPPGGPTRRGGGARAAARSARACGRSWCRARCR